MDKPKLKKLFDKLHNAGPVRSGQIRSRLTLLENIVYGIQSMQEQKKTIRRIYEWICSNNPTPEAASAAIIRAGIAVEGDHEFCRIQPNEYAIENFKNYLQNKMD